MSTIILYTRLNAPAEICFDLSRCVDVHVHSMKSSGETIVGGVKSGLMKQGDTVTWKARHLGIMQTLTSEITEMDLYRFFVDEQVKGAFHSFSHQHIFTQDKNGTLMKDIFHYSPPCGVLGLLADVLFLKKYMTRLLKTRNEVIKSVAESDNWKVFLKR